jgi:Zn-dependent peptidase ImmA (M78 family)
MVHEFVHLLLHADGVCDLDERKKPQSEEALVEAFCNRVAGAVLVPAPALLAAPGVAEASRGKDWSDDELVALARRFWVSSPWKKSEFRGMS